MVFDCSSPLIMLIDVPLSTQSSDRKINDDFETGKTVWNVVGDKVFGD
jgi:hypothetical protein